MLRATAGIISGYIAMAIAVFVVFAVAYLLLGADGAFKPGSWDPAGAWIVISIIVGGLTGILGGHVCALIARQPRGIHILAALVFVLGLAMAVPALSPSPDAPLPPRPSDVSMGDAMQQAQQPAWLAFLNPLLGACGVVVGGRLRRNRGPAAAHG